ncbi:tetratricopeptide repeat protein [Stakelama tenebrarum]|uniref:Tetratricopeptide repeat protein n=1 Tax=Stakelama tenebrarum TaxID=2711215 RepID=A0A6G6Y5X3_9SPHN|nr:tetratricopeptide repeat protein [Sphingosinithalassobacter tenebrarum]QIG80332.1 tetratricopeptide repeat protein [Sphingosinithalassobacter tenebrarum]
MIFYIATLLIQIFCIVHVIRTGRNGLWVLALIFLPMISAIAYFLVEILPGSGSNRHVRAARATAIRTFDPQRELREARDQLDLADTVANRMRVADALVALEQYGEAVPLYREAIARSAGGDARIQVKLARALFETGDTGAALAELDSLEPATVQSDRDQRQLLRARILEDMGRKEEALPLFADVASRYPGEEARCRYAALLLELGHQREALEVLEEVESRMKRLDRRQRAADANMYRWAMDELRKLRASGF